MSVIVLDASNTIIKAKIVRRENGEITFPHAMKQLTESEYEKITNRTGLSPKLILLYVTFHPRHRTQLQ